MTGPTRVAYGSFPGGNGLIAFNEENCGSQIAVMRPDGTHEHWLTRPPRGCRLDADRPSWAPNGRRLLIASNTKPGIALIDADGSHRTPLRGLPGQDWDPSFAPDGRHFAFTASIDLPSGGTRDAMYVAKTDGARVRRLGPGSLPTWSPNGRTIAFVARSDQEDDGTWLMNVRTGRVRRLWDRTAGSLDWSPDGRRLVAAYGGDLFIVRANDGHARHLVRTPPTPRETIDEWNAVWSPDGRRIAFIRQRTFDADITVQDEIWTINTRGRAAKRIWRDYVGFDYDGAEPDSLSWQPLPR